MMPNQRVAALRWPLGTARPLRHTEPPRPEHSGAPDSHLTLVGRGFSFVGMLWQAAEPREITERGVATPLALLLQTRTSYGSASPNPYGVAVL